MKKGSLNPRVLAVKVLGQITEEEAYADIALNRAMRANSLTSPDRAFLTELVYGTVKNLRYVDYLLSRFSTRPVTKLDPELRNLCRLGLYQIYLLEHIPNPVAVYETVEAAKSLVHKGALGFLNGLLRTAVRKVAQVHLPEDLSERLGVLHSHPQWLVDLWVERWGFEETERLCVANNQIPPLTLRVNTLRAQRETLLEELFQLGIKAEPAQLTPDGIILKQGVSVPNLDALNRGDCQVQDVGSMLVAHLVDPKPGDVVLDACSAPGGKTTHMAQLMGDKGAIVAADVNQARLSLVRENCLRLGVGIVETEVQDAALLFEREEWHGHFDKVLVDAPCSGLGVLRRRADSRWRREKEDLVELPRLQKAIISGAAEMVKPGGILVYSTCSIQPEENQDVVEWFLKRNPGWQVDDFHAHLELAAEFGSYLGGSNANLDKFLFLYPHREGTDGFFAARLRNNA